MIKYDTLSDGRYHIVMSHKLGSTFLRNCLNENLQIKTVYFYTTNESLIVPIRDPWSRLVSGQVQDFMDLIVKDNGIYANLSNDEKIKILSINDNETTHFKLFMKNLENGKYLNTVENDETVQIGYSIILKLFSESSNHEWWFDGHTWPDDMLSKIYNESKKRDIRFVKLEELSDLVNALFYVDVDEITKHEQSYDIIKQLSKVKEFFRHKDIEAADGGFLFGNREDGILLEPTEKKLFEQILQIENYYYELICSEHTKWWNSYDENQWMVTTQLKTFFDKVSKYSTFVVNTEETIVDINKLKYRKNQVKENDLWIFWLKHEAHLPFHGEKEYVLNIHKACKELEIDESKVVFINSDLDLDKNYDNWFNRYSEKYDLTKKINCIGFPWYFFHDKESITDEIGFNPYKFVKYIDRQNLPSKKFICLNGTQNKSRDYIIDKLKKYKNNGYLSDLSRGIQIDDISMGELTNENRSDEPSVLLLEDYHKDSYFSIVNEANGAWNSSIQDNVSAFFTEKITKPLYYGQPFILIGSRNSYKLLKKWGFETYDEIFDTSYDSLNTWEERTIAAWREIERVLNLSDSDFNKLFDGIQEKVIYNQKRFFEYNGYTNDLTKKLKELYK